MEKKTSTRPCRPRRPLDSRPLVACIADSRHERTDREIEKKTKGRKKEAEMAKINLYRHCMTNAAEDKPLLSATWMIRGFLSLKKRKS